MADVADVPDAGSRAACLARRIDGLMAELDALAEPGDVLRIAERLNRRIEAVMIRAMDAAERHEAHRADGHRSVQAWCRATVRWSAAEASDRWRTVRLARSQPEVGRALERGEVPVASVRALARAASNRRAHEAFVGATPELLRDASTMAVEPFGRLVRQVEQYLDADGAHRTAESVHAGRSAWVGAVGDEVVTRACHGMAQGAFIREVFDHYVQAEFALDATRPGAQCRADAMHAIFVAAAAARRSTVTPPTVNIVIDQATFEAALVELATGLPTSRLGDVSSYACRTLDGDRIDAYDAVAAALIGHVRRVVLGGDGLPVSLGRRARLFRGAAREAVWLGCGRRCVYPGCDARHCDVDHLSSWSHSGGTDVVNAAPLCSHHNRWKHERGYLVWRDPAGTWHTTRPDGAELIPAA